MRKIAFLTGSRSEWGYIRPLIRLIEKDKELSYEIIVTNTHLLSEFGSSVKEIESEFKVNEKIYMTLDGYNLETMTKSLGLLLAELPSVLRRVNPDVLVLAGDRGEQLMGAIAASHLKIPIAHIQAGELSGNIDGIVRHAITKLAHIHFAANKEFANRVIKMGEDKNRVFVTGATLTDELYKNKITEKKDLFKKYNINEDYILAVQHSVTEESDTENQIRETITALDNSGHLTILIYPNSDAGSQVIRDMLTKMKTSKFRLFRNVPREDYLGLMKNALAIVGNSSSGIMEAPTFSLPCVNIGRRQNKRLQSNNVINVKYDKRDILKAIKKATNPIFKKQIKKENPYGDGNASERIMRIIKELKINSELLNKEMSY